MSAGRIHPSCRPGILPGTLIALVVTALLTRKIKDVRFIVIYPVICLVTLIVVLSGQSQPLMIAGAFIIGWAGAGGLLQIATSVCNMLFPKIKGTVTALVMIASSLCNYTILTAASKMAPSQVHAHEHRAHGRRGHARSLCKSPLQKDGGACK